MDPQHHKCQSCEAFAQLATTKRNFFESSFRKGTLISTAAAGSSSMQRMELVVPCMHVTGHAMMLAGQWSPRRRMSCWCQRDIISLPGQADHAVVSAACTWKRWVARGGRETGTVGAGMVGLKLCRPFLLIAHCTHSLLLVYNPDFNTTGFSFNIIVALRLCTSTTTTTPISQPFF